MKLTAILLISLVLLFFTGIILTYSDSIYDAFKQMNDLIILDWFQKTTEHNTAILIWFIVLCCVAVLFGINLVLCSWDNLLKVALKRRGVKSILLFSIHLIFIVILVLHAISLVFGYKYGNIILKEGEEFKFENNYSLKLEKINFVDDYKILKSNKKSSRLEMTSDNFHYKQNYANLVLYKNDKTVIDGNAFVFSPLYGEGIQITVDKFVFDKKSDKLGAKICITKNPFEFLFFIFYGLGILSMLIYLIVSWKK